MEFKKLDQLLSQIRLDLIEKSWATFGETWVTASRKEDGEIDYELNRLVVKFPSRARWDIVKIESD